MPGNNKLLVAATLFILISGVKVCAQNPVGSLCISVADKTKNFVFSNITRKERTADQVMNFTHAALAITVTVHKKEYIRISTCDFDSTKLGVGYGFRAEEISIVIKSRRRRQKAMTVRIVHLGNFRHNAHIAFTPGKKYTIQAAAFTTRGSQKYMSIGDL